MIRYLFGDRRIGEYMDGQVLVIIGISLVAAAIVGFLVFLAIYLKRSKKLSMQLEQEYGREE